MRLCRFDDDRLGLVIDQSVHDVTALQDEVRAAAPFTMPGDPVVAALPGLRERLKQAAQETPGVPLDTVRLLAPVARPSKLVAAPSNYRSHIAEMGTGKREGTKHAGKIEQDGLFLKANSALVGASEGVPKRFPERRTDHELELVIVIGRQGTDITEDAALDHVAGYSLGLDMVVRGPEDRSFRKSCDGYAVLGPFLVTADEIADPDDLPLQLRVNGEMRQENQHQPDDLRGGTADRIRVVLLHAASGRLHLHRHAGRRGARPGGRRHHRRVPEHRQHGRAGAQPPAGASLMANSAAWPRGLAVQRISHATFRDA